MRRQRLLGRGQIAICMRSGIKCKASELVRDGRIPSLLVLPEWADPPQPQERPYVPDDAEGTPHWQPSPENPPVTPPVVSAEPNPEQTEIEVSWTAAERIAGPRIEYYELYRDSGAGFVLIETLEVEYTFTMEILGPALEFTDTDVEAGTTYTYRVTAYTSHGLALISNEAEVLMPDPVTPPVLVATIDEDLTTINVSWTALSVPADIYQLYRAPDDDGSPGEFELIFSGTDLTYEDSPGAGTWWYFVVAVYQETEFESNEDSAVVPVAPEAPILSGELDVLDFDLSWTVPASENPIAGYRLYRSVDGAAFALLVDQVGTTYTDPLTEDHSYQYYVEAYDTLGLVSPQSNQVSVAIGVSREVFTADTTWNMPDGLVSLVYYLIGAGGGGGSGNRQFPDATGGGGGGGGEYRSGTILAASLGATETIVIGSGGVGGAGTTSNQGNNGTDGGASSFGTHATANGGRGGRGGARPAGSNGQGGTGGSGGTSSEDGGNGSFGTAPSSAPAPPPATGGSTVKSGAGGGGASGRTTFGGAPGGAGGSVTDPGNTVAGGTAGTQSSGDPAGDGGDSVVDGAGGGGGGGGSPPPSSDPTPVGGPGGNGGSYGAGGGGGGPARGGGVIASAPGGNGEQGVLVLEYTYAP
jgi:hypothetical protein